METLALTATAVLGLSCILPKLFSSSDDTARVSSTFAFRDGSVTEQSKRACVQTRPITLILGVAAGVIAVPVAGSLHLNWTNLGVWVRQHARVYTFVSFFFFRR